MRARSTGGQQPTGERIAALETIVPEIKDDMIEVKEGLKSLHAKMDRFIEKVNQDLDGKAGKAALNDVRKDVTELQKKVWYASGGASLLGMLMGWFVKQWMGGGQ